MKESVRGGIRAKPNAISWVYSFLNLSSWTKSDPISMIRAWYLNTTISGLYCFSQSFQQLLTGGLCLFQGFQTSTRNEEASRDDRLVSTKKTSVTSVLDLPVTAREILLAIVSEFGFEGA